MNPRSDTSTRPPVGIGTWTRRPSDVTTTAIGRRSRPLLRPTLAVSDALLTRGRGPCVSGSLASLVERATTLTPPDRTGVCWRRGAFAPGACSRGPGVDRIMGVRGGSWTVHALRLAALFATPCAGSPRRLRSGVLLARSGGESGHRHALRHLGRCTRRSAFVVRHSRAPGHPGAFARRPCSQNERTVDARRSVQQHRCGVSAAIVTSGDPPEGRRPCWPGW
jgi:hypothetical protein